MIDPLTAQPPGSPKTYLMCPEASCAATPDAISPSFDRPVEELERAWRATIERELRVALVGRDTARRLYVFEQRSALFRFPDLVSVRFLPSSGGSTLAVYGRSVYGYWDLGVNRKRVRTWLAKTERALAEGASAITRKAPPLEGYRWENRPLAVFAPSPESQPLSEQMRTLREGATSLDERDVAVVTVVGGDVDDPGGRVRGGASGMRAAYDVDEAGFAVLLVGKDGGVKLCAAEPVPVERLFALIDAMPMRQREMRTPMDAAP